MRYGRTTFLLAAIALTCSGAAHAQFSTNLIVNSDAEAGTGSATGNDIETVPGWTTSGNFTVVQYDIGGGFPASTDPSPANRGSNFFAGGPANGGSFATQSINVATGATTIDLGNVTYNLSGYLGGFDGQRDNATLTATFLDGSNATLGTASIGPVSEADRNGLTGLLLRGNSGLLPTGVRTINLTLNMVRVDGSYNDGYADNLSLVLTASPVPEPGTVAFLIGMSITGAGFLARRCKN